VEYVAVLLHIQERRGLKSRPADLLFQQFSNGTTLMHNVKVDKVVENYTQAGLFLLEELNCHSKCNSK
jgi:hypothetical protein